MNKNIFNQSYSYTRIEDKKLIFFFIIVFIVTTAEKKRTQLKNIMLMTHNTNEYCSLGDLLKS